MSRLATLPVPLSASYVRPFARGALRPPGLRLHISSARPIACWRNQLTWRIRNDGIEQFPSSPRISCNVKRYAVQDLVPDAIMLGRSEDAGTGGIWTYRSAHPLMPNRCRHTFASHLSPVDIAPENVGSPVGADIQQRPCSGKRIIDQFSIIRLRRNGH